MTATTSPTLTTPTKNGYIKYLATTSPTLTRPTKNGYIKYLATTPTIDLTFVIKKKMKHFYACTK